nr:MAG TPA: hypothetical protein [Caudoviricetes sp.]
MPAIKNLDIKIFSLHFKISEVERGVSTSTKV